MEKARLIINLGLRSMRSIIFDTSGKKLTHAWLPVKTRLEGAKVEQSPEEWWKLCKRVVKESITQLKEPVEISHITVTSSSALLVCLDKAGNPTYDAIIVSDKRSEKQAAKLREDPEIKHIFEHPNFLAVPSYMFPKMTWLHEHEPEIFKKTAYFCSSNDYLIYKFTGKLLTDSLNAEKFYYDDEKKAYPEVLLKRLNITEKQLPPVVPIGTGAGKVKEQIAKELNISAETEVIVTTYDALCAFWGSGITEEGQANNVCGTVGSIRLLAQKKPQKTNHNVLHQEFPLVKATIVGCSNNIEGGLLEWAKSCFYGESYYNDMEFLFRLMEEEAGKSSVGAEGLIFLPYIVGERAPFNDPNVRGIFFGLERKHSRKDIIRSIYESLGYQTNVMIDAIEAAGTHIKELHLSGGLAKNQFIAQLKADISGKPVKLLKELETTSFGALMLLELSLNQNIDLKKFAEQVTIEKTFLPNPEKNEQYNKIYKLFKNIYSHNQQNFIDRQTIVDTMYGGKSHTIDNL